MARSAPILLVATLLLSCTSAGTSQSPRPSNESATATPIASVVTSTSPGVAVSPSSNPTQAPPTPTPTSTAQPVGGWPTVDRAGIAMTGAVEDRGDMDGRLGLAITMTGLAPGEAVTLSAAGEYVIRWQCGTEPEPCGEIGCAPAVRSTTEGATEADARAVAASDGTATARIVLAATPPAGTCPADPTSPWGTSRERWEKVGVADPAHGLRLTPDAIERGETY